MSECSGASLPPGPPSSSAGQSVAEQEVMRNAPLTCTDAHQQRRAQSTHGVAYRVGVQLEPSPTAGTLPAATTLVAPALRLAAAPLPPLVAGGAPPALPSMQMGPFGPPSTPFRSSITNLAPALNWPAAPARKPRNRLAYTKTAYLEFCQRTRPLLSNALGNAERETVLGQQWKALSKAEKAKYKVHGESETSAPAHTPSAASAATRTVVARSAGTTALEDAHSKAKRHSPALAAPPAAPPAPFAVLAAPNAPADPGFEMLPHTLEHMTEEEVMEVLLGSDLSAGDQELLFSPGALRPSQPTG